MYTHAHPHSCEQRCAHVQHHRHTYINIKHSESLYRGKDKVPSSTPSAHLSQDPRPADDTIQLTSWCKQDVAPSPEVNQGLLISKLFCKLRRMISRAFSTSHSMNATKVMIKIPPKKLTCSRKCRWCVSGFIRGHQHTLGEGGCSYSVRFCAEVDLDLTSRAKQGSQRVVIRETCVLRPPNSKQNDLEHGLWWGTCVASGNTIWANPLLSHGPDRWKHIRDVRERAGGFRMMGNVLWVKLGYRHRTKNW